MGTLIFGNNIYGLHSYVRENGYRKRDVKRPFYGFVFFPKMRYFSSRSISSCSLQKSGSFILGDDKLESQIC